MAGRGEAGLGPAWHGTARQGSQWLENDTSKASPGLARRGEAWPGKARHGEAWRGMVPYGQFFTS